MILMRLLPPPLLQTTAQDTTTFTTKCKAPLGSLELLTTPSQTATPLWDQTASSAAARTAQTLTTIDSTAATVKPLHTILRQPFTCFLCTLTAAASVVRLTLGTPATTCKWSSDSPSAQSLPSLVTPSPQKRRWPAAPAKVTPQPSTASAIALVQI